MYFNLTYTNIENCDVLLNNYIVFVRKLSSIPVQYFKSPQPQIITYKRWNLFQQIINCTNQYNIEDNTGIDFSDPLIVDRTSYIISSIKTTDNMTLSNKEYLVTLIIIQILFTEYKINNYKDVMRCHNDVIQRRYYNCLLFIVVSECFIFYT